AGDPCAETGAARTLVARRRSPGHVLKAPPMTTRSHPADDLPHVVIVGGGFAGLAAARSLAKAPVRITLVDRRNHHLFQPLLYQVATAGLSAPAIAAPLRHILRGQRNVSILMADVRDIDLSARRVDLDRGDLGYDYL